MTRVIVIGANAAGMSAASQIKRQQPDWEVTVYEKGPYISYAGCGIPYYIQGLVTNLEDLLTLTPEEASEERNLDIKLRHSVTSIDPHQNLVTFTSREGTANDSFDYLVTATGARPQSGDIEVSSSKRIFFVHTLEDAIAIQEYIETENPTRCAVIGGGYIALEMLEALIDRGLKTDMIHRRSELSRNFEKEISDITLRAIENAGVTLKLNQPVTRIIDTGSEVTVETEEELLRYDLVIMATGVEPNSELAVDCGIETGIRNSIRVNEYMQTNFPNIYSAGDCTETRDLISGRPVYLPLALKANKEGVTAGINISGGKEAFPGVLGSAITKFFDLGIARTGLTYAEAVDAGFEAIKFELTANSRAHYYPGRGRLAAVLIADRNDGRLLGAQLAGPLDSVKRIDTYATALTAKMTLEQIFQLDLAYAPPFSPVYDPVVLTGRVGRKKVGR